ncbi:hypothetical protein COCON_G00100210 [Conger conger]|uniref:BTB domain-containing protein n=1 Tax=Conger conger TaxID=82655 RepID=A0A9Q1DMU8_CONCO|nr:hypothetical protein COCON_G00100210 [Conger conger]
MSLCGGTAAAQAGTQTCNPVVCQRRSSDLGLLGSSLGPPVVAVSQAGLLPHSYGLAPPPVYTPGVTVQSPAVGVTPAGPPHPPHPLMPAHFQLAPPPRAILPTHPSLAPPLTLPAFGNGHMTHPTMLSNGQVAPLALPIPPANRESPNGLQMLRTIGMGKYEFTDPGHPKEMLAELDRQRRNREFTDLTITVEGREFEVHQNVVASGSVYIKDLVKRAVEKRFLSQASSHSYCALK